MVLPNPSQIPDPWDTSIPQEIDAEVEVYQGEESIEEDGALKVLFEVPPPMGEETSLGKRRRKKINLGRSTAEAYANGIAKLLERQGDEIIESLREKPEKKPDPSDKPKERNKRATKFVNVKYGSGSKNAPNFNTFIGGKIMAAFKNAALARKEFIDMGGSVEELKGRSFLKDRFITKALGFEFGGDAINRTRGTFSSDPGLTEDPALSRGQRFSAGIRPLMSSVLPATSVDYSAAADAGIAPEVSPIDASYSNILDAYSFAGSSLQGEVEVEKKGSYTDSLIKEKIQEIIGIIQNKENISKEKLNLSREEKEIEQEQSDKKKIGRREKLLEGVLGAAGIQKYVAALPENPFEKALDFIYGEKEEDDKDDGPWWQDLLGFGAEIAGEEAAERGIKGLADKFLKRRAAQTVATSAATTGGIGGSGVSAGAGVGAATAASIILGVGLASSALGEGSFQLRKLGKAGEEWAYKNYEEKNWADPRKQLDFLLWQGARFTNHILNGLGTALDIVGAPFRYAIELIRYPFLNEKDKKKQAENLAKFDARIREQMRELLNVATLGLAFTEKGEFGNMFGNDEAQREMMTKMAEGSAPFKVDALPTQKIQNARDKVMVGEANTSDEKGELVGNKTEIAMMVNQRLAESKNNVIYSSARLILGVVDNLLSRSGPIGNALKPFITQKLGAAMKYFGMEEVNQSTGFGQGKTKDVTPMSAADFLTGGDGGIGGGDGDGDGDNLPPGVPLPKDREAAAKVLMNGLMKRGFSREESAVIVGNLWAESRFDVNAVNPKSGAYGLMQWLGSRKDNLDNFAEQKGKSISDAELQMDFIAWELQGGDSYETSQFQKALAYGDSIGMKVKGFGYEVERAAPNDLENSMADRIGAAESAYSLGEGGGSNNAIVRKNQTPKPNYRKTSTSGFIPAKTSPAETVETVSNNMSSGSGVVIIPVVVGGNDDAMIDAPTPPSSLISVPSYEPDRMKMLKNIIRERQ